ncbi:MAG: thioredoxin family protein, partial [Chthoniobacteraceae bacterium]|nr:thioredoxin family protein [Chthoniobacteraceae bacterium]
WCTWCIRLRKEVFETELFKKEAPSKFVLVELDFPQDSSAQPEATRVQNKKLQDQFGIKGYPTIFLSDASGRPYAQLGYEKGGPEVYLKSLEDARANRVKRDAAFQKAETFAGLDKAKALQDGLAILPDELVSAHYKSTVDEIRGLDPKDTLGVDSKFGLVQALQDLQKQLKEKAGDGSESLRTVVDQFVAARPKLTPKQKQIALLDVLNYFVPPKDNAAALKLLDDVSALAPESEEGKMASQIRERVQRMLTK